MKRITLILASVFISSLVCAQDTIQAQFSTVDVCNGDEVVFTNTSKVPVKFGGANYFWTFGDGGTSNAQFPKHTYILDDTTVGQRYEVKLVVQSKSIPSEKDSVIDFVEIFPNPDASFTWDVDNKGTTQDVIIASQASTSATNFYQWNLAGVLKSNEITPKFLYVDVKPFLDGSNYDFTLLVKTLDGCESTYSTKFNYNPLSIGELSLEQNLVYPNPSQGQIVFKSPLTNPTVRNSAGQVVYKELGLLNNLNLAIPPGLYFLTAELNGTGIAQRLMVE